MTEQEKFCWAAGFLEGEGCFYCSPHGTRSSIRVIATQVQKHPLVDLQILFGGKIYLKRGREYRQPLWQWHLTGAPGARLMERLRSFMSPRRQGQIDKAMARYRDRLLVGGPKAHRKTHSDVRQLRLIS